MRTATPKLASQTAKVKKRKNNSRFILEVIARLASLKKKTRAINSKAKRLKNRLFHFLTKLYKARASITLIFILKRLSQEGTRVKIKKRDA